MQSPICSASARSCSATPRTIDCSVFAFVDSVLGFPLDSPIKQRVAARANLVAYRTRVRERWWKDLPDLAS
jgi:hypothetical protein